jgi:hypothetical protein
MADFKSIPDAWEEARNTPIDVTDTRRKPERDYEGNFFALSPLQSRPWDVPDLASFNASALTEDQINNILNIANPPQAPLWSSLVSTGEPADLSSKVSMSTKTSSKGSPTTTPIDTKMGIGTPTNFDFSDKEMEQALANQREGLLTNQLIKGGVEMGRAIAGTQSNAPILEGQDELTGLPVKQLLEGRKAQYDKFTREKEMQDKAEAADPNSQHSVSYRNLAKSMLDMQGLPNISKAIDGLSAEQIDKKFPMISNIVTAKMAQDSKKEAAATLAASKQEAKQFKINQGNADKELALSKIVAKTDDNLKYSQGVYNLEKFREAISSRPSGVLDVGLIYDYVKALDPTSAVREGEVDFIKTASPFFQNIANLPKRITRGDVLPPSVREQILKNIEMFNQSKRSQFLSHLKPIVGQIKTNGLNADNILLGTPGVTSDDIYNPEKKQNEQKKNKTLIKKQYSQSANKTKFMYSDGTEEIVDGKQ